MENTVFDRRRVLKNCDTPNLPKSIPSHFGDQRKPRGGIFTFFSHPFILRKETNSIVLQFSKVITYDIKLKLISTTAIATFILITLYRVLMPFWGIAEIIPDLVKDPIDLGGLAFLLFLLTLLSLPILVLAVLVYFLLRQSLEYMFTTVRVGFTENELIVVKKVFGIGLQVAKLSPSELLPREEKRVNTQFPNVRNSLLKMHYRRKKLELAGHLLPPAMDLVKDTYDRYRRDSSSTFYSQTQEACIE